jgi:FkbM family methyltransferase
MTDKRKPPPDADRPLYLRALAYARSGAAAIDGGANVGNWSRWMAEHFDAVHAFEPNPRCWPAFEDMPPGVVLHRAALGEAAGEAWLYQPPKRRATTAGYVGSAEHAPPVERPRAEPVAVATVDGLGLTRCGLLKLDIEGGELYALRGSRQTLARCRPVVVVEVSALSHKHYGVPEADVRRLLSDARYTRLTLAAPNEIWVPL